MPHYILIARDKPESLELRMATRPDHLAYIESFGSKARLGGAILDDAEKPAGSVIVLEMDSLAEAQQFAADDPYNKAGLFSSVEILPYRIAVDTMSK